MVEHELTPEQTRIYDAYAGAFAIIHNNLDAAMEAANITGSSGTLNRQAKSAARSAFESTKQRFFGHLLTSMKTPTLLRSIARDLEDGHAAVVQIVSTGEALTERRLAEVPTEEWNDLRIDITPREYVGPRILQNSFPVQLYEPFTDSEGTSSSRPVTRDGQPVESREAVARRDALIEKLGSLPPVPRRARPDRPAFRDGYGGGSHRPLGLAPSKVVLREAGFGPLEDGAMAQKKHKPRRDCREAPSGRRFGVAGRPVAEAIRTIGVTAFTYYRWRKEFGGLKSDQVKRLRDLEKENERLRKAVSDLTLEKLIPKEAASGNF